VRLTRLRGDAEREDESLVIQRLAIVGHFVREYVAQGDALLKGSSMNQPAPPSPQKSGFPTWLVILLVAIGSLIVIIGIFAVFAIYGVRTYIANAKTVEARNAVTILAKDATAAYERDGKLCPSASSPIPATVPHAAKYQSSPSEWEVDKATNAGFACLKFQLDYPQYYQYDYKSTPAGFTVTAHGDLDGDGVESTFELEGRVTGGVVSVSPVIKETKPEE
jgi:type IV pilus assembly protein PilA